jgi:hypothetical protein
VQDGRRNGDQKDEKPIRAIGRGRSLLRPFIDLFLSAFKSF